MNRVKILLSTHNGAARLGPLLRSLAEQTWPDIGVDIRDDGSRDGTLELAEAFCRDREGWRLTAGDNVGVFESFMSLLKDAGDDAGYYAFCDQDDVWLSGKVERAVGWIDALDPGEPVLYCSRLEFVNDRLEHLGLSRLPRTYGFHTALVQNLASGCTLVMNSAARRLVLDSLPSWALMHDWWCYLVVSALGRVVFDPKPSIRYRKHAGNVTPASPFFPRELVSRAKLHFSASAGAKRIGDQAEEFYRLFGSRLDADSKAIVEEFLEARNAGLTGRFRYALAMPLRRHFWFETLLLRTIIVSGRF